MKYAIVEAGGKMATAPKKVNHYGDLTRKYRRCSHSRIAPMVAEDDKIEIGTPTIKGASLKPLLWSS